MPSWVVLIIVLAAIIVLYLASSLAVYLFSRAFKKKMLIAKDNLFPLEKERFNTIKKIIDNMIENGRVFPKNLIESKEEIEQMLNTQYVDVIDLKGRCDYLYIYLYKYMQEKKLSTKQEFQNQYTLLENDVNSNLKRRDKSSPYEIYNRAASKYNATLSLPFLSFFTRRNNQTATLI